MILTEVKKIKVALSELQRCIPVKLDTFTTTAKHFECKELLPINSVDELIAYDSYIKQGTDFKADYVRVFSSSVNWSMEIFCFFIDGISVNIRW